ncbi:hypothetical protein X797_007440 [Metarhizium robertsii]|uniref:Uncharacterized protein n=1 Tax=Metarhizium robertsii TaxID=568076 RepID=A0A014QXI3_9HYPO|nr:hypothetical protein X797_007440 [Metarhizium robertsii]
MAFFKSFKSALGIRPSTQNRLEYNIVEAQEQDNGGNDLKSSYNTVHSRYHCAPGHRHLLAWVIAAVLTTALAIILCIALGYWAVMMRSQPHSELVKSVQHNCGNTAAEARSLGCEFDILTNNWIPSACAENVTASEFRAWVFETKRLHGPWPYFHDDGAMEQIESELQLSEMVGHRIFTTTENHIGHCVFLMRRIHRLVKGEIKQIARITFDHTMHCTNEILRAVGNPDFEDRGNITSIFKVDIADVCLNQYSRRKLVIIVLGANFCYTFCILSLCVYDHRN